MSTALVEPDVEEAETDNDKIIHRCCQTCWPLPGPAQAYCGIFKTWTHLVRGVRPDRVCKVCKDPEVQKSHQCFPR